jgi:uncharacterized repeat protein (TIGR01451 family)
MTGHVPPAAKLSRSVGIVPGTNVLRLAIGLELRSRKELEGLLGQIYDPASTSYQQYLTPKEFADRFGPTEADYVRVADFARRNHLKVVATHANRLVLDVTGTAADIDRTFGVTLQTFQHPREPRRFFAPNTEPRIPSELPILHISGLNNFVVPHPAGLSRVATGQATPQSGAGPGGSYRGSDFRGAYARGVSLTGAGQMAGLLEFDGYYLSDITSYESQTALPNVPLINVTLDGYDGTPSVNNEEVSLDIEMVASMAPGLAAIIVYAAGTEGVGNDILSRMATDNLAKQLSSSWTFPTDPVTEQIFLEFAAQGQTFFNASGDSGAYSGPVASPADSPNVTSVGGTTLVTTGPGGAWSSETAWNRGTTGALVAASGGGTSTSFAIPTWQQPVSMSGNGGSVIRRNLPDVAAVADNVWITFNNGANESVGGTSCSSPFWCGYMALVNQQAASFGRPSVGFLNPTIYRLGLGAGYTTNFHDVTIGNNTTDTSPTNFFAVPGYDLCTGWGSPLGQNLINALASRFAAPFLTNISATIVSEGCSPANGVLDPGETVTVSFSFKNIGGIKTTNLLATLLSEGGVRWPGAPQAYGTLLPGGVAASRQFSFTADGVCGGDVLATLQLQDGATDLGRLVFELPLGKPVTVFTQNFDAVTPPALPADWTTMASNGVSAWVTSTTVHDTAANAAFADEPPFIGVEDLISPAIPIGSPRAQLTFRQFYNTEADPVDVTAAYDGGFLEIQIGTNDFIDIVDAGGVFVTGGYNHVISTATNSDNPFPAKPVWGGNSGGFTTTTVTLPASAAGQSIQLRWRFAIDTGNFFGGSGWYIDSVSVRDGAACCVPLADLQLLSSVSPEPVAPGQPLTYSVSVTNQGPGTAYGATLTNVVPTSLVFVSGSSGCVFTNGVVLCLAGALPAGASTNFSFVFLATASEGITNQMNAWAFTPDPDESNNGADQVSTLATNGAPFIYLGQTKVIGVSGASAKLQAAAFGPAPLAYQWFFNGNMLAGETLSSLTLTNLTLSQSGPYWVQVTNANGSTISDVVQLIVVDAPGVTVTGLDPNSGSVNLSVPSVSGLTYTLQYKAALNDAEWTAILPPTSGTGNPVTLVDTNASGTLVRFYRIVAH